MNEWPIVRWTQARQLVRLLDAKAAAPAEAIVPSAWFATLVAAGQLDDAAEFLGVALPRFECVAWAMQAITAMPRADTAAAGDADAARAVKAWLDNPDDDHRRAAHAAAEAADEASPEHLLGLAVFMSGGSIAPADLDAVNPEPDICGRMAAAAVITAAYATEDPATALSQALAAGDKIARGN